ncbi:hypothetical protein MLD38_011308 [Melastoma candidum]|uniref:Uncharacterized protein n=1 Tax=Melastoma candidum TaxID=119954 RepID=A0ACB9R2P5_9MYRT|nr:hypothetical protein MLD38_011308 [Melastoma candidum]
MSLSRSLSFLVLLAILLGQVPSAMSDDGLDYGAALGKSLMFFEAQRSGKLPTDRRVWWRGDSALDDGFLQGVDLVGGYYDAGDHVKFGLPMAFSLTMLSWGAIEGSKEITGLNQMGNTLDAIRWGTDYLIKAHPQPNLLWAQVGDGSSDHYCWERPEDMTTSREAYEIDQEHPGSDVAAETAAALAAAALAFRLHNSSYSDLLLVHAKQDELLWAATWLYKASGDESYLKYTINNAASMGGTGYSAQEFSWDTKYAGLQVLLSEVLMDNPKSQYASVLKQYREKAEYFICSCLKKNDGYDVPRTPGGLLYLQQWNNMQYVSSASFLLAVYSSYLTAANLQITCPKARLQPQELLNFAKSQADYILGKNPKSISYLVGYGPNYPTHVHHRGASIAPKSVLQSDVGCVQGFDTWYHRPQPNPNIVHGALVGGPDKNDGFSDERSNYEQTEPTLSAAAPLIGLFSKLYKAYGGPGNSSTDHRQPYTGPASAAPVEFLHSITSSWNQGKVTFYHHQVIIKNVSQKPITYLKVHLENLTGSIWGLNPTKEKSIYELPPHQVLSPSSQYMFVYVQGGPQAKITVLSCY